jgi:hypothetical protein
VVPLVFKTSLGVVRSPEGSTPSLLRQSDHLGCLFVGGNESRREALICGSSARRMDSLVWGWRSISHLKIVRLYTMINVIAPTQFAFLTLGIVFIKIMIQANSDYQFRDIQTFNVTKKLPTKSFGG